MLLSLSLFLVAIILILFLNVTVRVIYLKSFSFEIEIQPLRIVFYADKDKNRKRRERKGSVSSLRWIRFFRKIIPHCKIRINTLSFNFSASEMHSAYNGAAITAAALYPIISLIKLYSEKMSVDHNSPKIYTEIDEKTAITPSIDVSFELRLYYLIFIFIRCFSRKKKGASV